MNKHHIFRWFLFTLPIVAIACSTEKTQEPSPTINLADGWTYSDSLFFNNISRTLLDKGYELNLSIGISDTFSYENIYVKSFIKTSGERVFSDIFSVQLADKFGNWLGNCRSSLCYIQQPILLDSIKAISEEEAISITITPWTRDSILYGIENVRLVWSKKD